MEAASSIPAVLPTLTDKAQDQAITSVTTPFSLPGRSKSMRKFMSALSLREKTWGISIKDEPRKFIERLVQDNISCNTWKAYCSTLINQFNIDRRYFRGITFQGIEKNDWELSSISKEEILKICEDLSERDKAILSVFYGTGGRRSDEVRQLRWEDVFLHRDKLNKTRVFIFKILLLKSHGKKHYVELPEKESPEFFNYFLKYYENSRSKNPGEYVFVSRAKNYINKLMSAEGFRSHVSELIGMPTHAMRRGKAKEMVEEGYTPLEMADKMGHRSTRQSYNYFRKAAQENLHRLAKESQNTEDIPL